MKRWLAGVAVLLVVLIFFTIPREVRVRATTTTSLYATGLLDFLEEKFREREPRVEVDFIAVGSGEALRRASNGDACLVFVHAPSLEREYLERGSIYDGRIFAYNYFIIAGPPEDPAGVNGANSPVKAFSLIFRAGERGKAVFVSRGDNSGTHVKEMSLWKASGLDPRGKRWYLETGSGMGNTLMVANEKNGYVLTDVGTYLKFKSEGKLPNLEVLFQGGEELLNVYSVYLVTSCKGEEAKIAKEFADFVAEDAQDLIGSYGVKEYGRPLFYPAKGKEEWLSSMWDRLARG